MQNIKLNLKLNGKGYQRHFFRYMWRETKKIHKSNQEIYKLNGNEHYIDQLGSSEYLVQKVDTKYNFFINNEYLVGLTKINPYQKNRKLHN